MLDKQSINQFLKSAEDDLNLSQGSLIKYIKPYIDDSCHHSYQAGKKSLIAFLLFLNSNTDICLKNSGLGQLLSVCQTYDPEISILLSNCLILDSYPFIDFSSYNNDCVYLQIANLFLDSAQNLYKTVYDKINDTIIT